MKPTLRQLEYAVAVADQLHFGRAARACSVSQPALSVQIKQLERGLGIQLFERSRRRVEVTAAGTGFVRRARAILRDVADLVEEARPAAAPLSGTVRLGGERTIAPYLFPRLLPEVRARYPDLRLLLEERRADHLLGRLLDGRLDLLLGPLPAEGRGLVSMGLFRERLVVVMPTGHPLSEREAIRGSDLAAERVLLLSEGHPLREQTLEICGPAGGGAVPDVQGTSLATMVQMVANGIGIAILPALAAKAEVLPGTGVEVRPFARPAPRRAIGLAFRRASPRREECRRLGSLFRSALLEPAT